MAVLTDAEMQLKENLEMRTGIDKTNKEFKDMLKNSKSLQQQLRAINRDLREQEGLYKDIRDINEKFYESLDKRKNILKDFGKDIYNNLMGSQKALNKVADEFKDFTNKLNTGNVSLKEYKKNLDKLSNIETTLSNQKLLLDVELSNSSKRLELLEKENNKKNTIYNKLGKKTREDFKKEILEKERATQYSLSRIEMLENRKLKSLTKKDSTNIDKEIKFESKQKKSLEKEISDLKKKYDKAVSIKDLDENDRKELFEKSKRENIKKTISDIDKQKGSLQKIKEEYAQTEKQIKRNEKALGNVGRIVGVMQHLGVNRIFDFEKIEDAMQGAAQRAAQLKSIGDKPPVAGTLRAGVGAMGSELMGKFGVVGAVGGGIWLTKQIADLFFMIDERTTNIAKNHNVTRIDAESILASYSKMAIANEKISVYGQQIAKTSATQKELLEASLEISQLFGVNYSIVNKQEGDLIANIKNRMGLSDDVRQSMLEGSMVANEGFEDYFDKILGVNAVNRANNKFYMNDKALLMDMAKTSSSIRLQFRNHSMDLAQIVINSKKYGTNLQQLDSSMGGMLDWENQLTLQTSFHAQTGRLIDTSRLQYYAMYNDMENYQKEFDKLLPSVKEYEGYTRYAQQTVAEMFGFDRDGMAQMYLDKEVMKKINADERAKKEYDYRQTEIQMKKEYDALKERGLSHETITKILGHNSQILLSDISSAEDFSRALEKIKDTFATFINKGGVEKLVDSVTGMTQNIHQFLEKWGDVLGIRSKTNVLEKYDTSGIMDNGVYDLAKALSENKKNPTLNIEERKDFEYIAKEYQQQYKISDERFQEYSNNLEKTLQNYKNLQSYDKVGLEEVMNDFSRKFYESSLPKGVLSNELPVGGKFLNKNIQSMNDGMISPRGNIVIKTPEGQIMPNKKDYLIATTNPNSLLSKNPSQSITQYLIDDTKIVSTMEMVRKAVEQSTVEIVKAVSQNREVNLNGRKVGEMINMSNNRI